MVVFLAQTFAAYVTMIVFVGVGRLMESCGSILAATVNRSRAPARHPQAKTAMATDTSPPLSNVNSFQFIHGYEAQQVDILFLDNYAWSKILPE